LKGNPGLVVAVTLSLEQPAVLGPLIDTHRETTDVVGLVGAITRSYRQRNDRVALERLAEKYPSGQDGQSDTYRHKARGVKTDGLSQSCRGERLSPEGA
jgi:hypothetical protein